MATEEAVNDVVPARKWTAPLRWSAGGRAVAMSVGYVGLYLALDRLSFIGAPYVFSHFGMVIIPPRVFDRHQILLTTRHDSVHKRLIFESLISYSHI
jgi:hypothetical protein